MKPLLRTVAVAALLLLAAAIAGVAQPRLAHTASGSSGATITVTGNGTADAVPDRASFQFGVDTRAANARDALTRNSSAAAAVVAALKTAGVDGADLQTSVVSLSPQTGSDGNTIVGYAATNSVSAAVPLAKAGSVVDAAVGAGADSVSGPSLDTSDRDALYRDALKRAVADAKAKAEALAASAGVQLGAVRTISEAGAPEPLPYAARAAALGPAVPIEAGTQQVSATVTVTFAAGG
jgi:uncharacterized protein YggE